MKAKSTQGSNYLRSNYLIVLCFLIFVVVGCRSVVEPGKDIFLEERSVDPERFEVFGYTEIKKTGFSIFGFIPCSIADRREGEILLINNAREKYPEIDGVCDIKFNIESPSFFDWTPVVEMAGKVVKKKAPGSQ